MIEETGSERGYLLVAVYKAWKGYHRVVAQKRSPPKNFFLKKHRKLTLPKTSENSTSAHPIRGGAIITQCPVHGMARMTGEEK